MDSAKGAKELDIRLAIAVLENSANNLAERVSHLYDKQTFVMSAQSVPEPEPSKREDPQSIDGLTPMSQILFGIKDKIENITSYINLILNQTEF